MPSYVLLTTLTAEGGQTLHSHPERMLEVNREVTEFGCKVLSQYATLGPYDFITIVEAADNAEIMQLSIGLSARGTLKIMSLPATPVQDLVEKLKGPKKMGRK